ncbi:hypothetical protein IDH44_13565 [Paenibacillus sp. IB182496]|uniref:Uncharacterized protein n=1 Tax=Paenibacillus sabuli TaxID=2772509 RepID=A0A927BVE9_9BACL|nr:hypothetical protein [Paenibacillus sabuli]MBD2846229.1 hypothetical protein [Paenibacillus sabuli]
MLKSASEPVKLRIARILHPSNPLCAADVIWLLEWIKKKVADDAPRLALVPQPHLIRSYTCFAEAAMALIHQRHGRILEAERLRAALAEAIAAVSAGA